MNYPIVGVVVLLLTSGALGALGWHMVQAWKNDTWKDDE